MLDTGETEMNIKPVFTLKVTQEPVGVAAIYIPANNALGLS